MSSHNPFHHQSDAGKPRIVPLKQELPQKNKKIELSQKTRTVLRKRNCLIKTRTVSKNEN